MHMLHAFIFSKFALLLFFLILTLPVCFSSVPLLRSCKCLMRVGCAYHMHIYRIQENIRLIRNNQLLRLHGCSLFLFTRNIIAMKMNVMKFDALQRRAPALRVSFCDSTHLWRRISFMLLNSSLCSRCEHATRECVLANHDWERVT